MEAFSTWIIGIFDKAKIVVYTFFCSSLFLLFAKQEWLDFLKISNFKNDNEMWIGLTLVFTTSFVFIDLLKMFKVPFSFIYQFISKKIKIRKEKAIRIKFLSQLDYKEKAIIREFFITHENTLELPVQDSTIAGLMAKRILVPVSNIPGITNRGLSISAQLAISNDYKSLFTEELLTDGLSNDEILKMRPCF